VLLVKISGPNVAIAHKIIAAKIISGIITAITIAATALPVDNFCNFFRPIPKIMRDQIPVIKLTIGIQPKIYVGVLLKNRALIVVL
jgi:hypothetical protein